MQQHHGVEIRDYGADVEGGRGGEGRDDAKCRQDLEVVVAFVDEWEVGAFAA